MLQLDIDDTEVPMLREILASDLSELGYEIANTDSQEFREQLRQKQRLLKRVVGQLGDA